MRILSAFFRRLGPCLLAVGLPLIGRAADNPGNVVLQYHFIGATKLAENTNVAVAKQVFSLKTSGRFENLVLFRLATNFAATLHWPVTEQTVKLLRPLQDDLLLDESLASLGGSPGQPLNYVVAVHLDASRAQTWQENLTAINGGPGEEIHVDGFSGRQWRKGNDTFWMAPARDWMLAGRGNDLASARSDYLQQIQKTGRPAPALDFNCFEADIDWPRLANWFTVPFCPLKLGRAQLGINVEKNSFRMNCQMTYAAPIQWQSEPWRIPTNLVRQPLVSFVAAQDVEPFLKSDTTMARFATDPMRGQFLFWSMGEMPFQSYLAWPVVDGTNTMRELSSQLLMAVNPKLKAIDGTELQWVPASAEIVWAKEQMTAPMMHAVQTRAGPFLLAGLFPATRGTGPAPEALWAQVVDRRDLIYYDWEMTGPRITELRTLTETFPIMQALGMGPNMMDLGTSNHPSEALVRLRVNDQWLNGLSKLLHNTVTEVTKTGPSEVTILRSSPFVFSSLELVLLSHWLTGTPAGPINKGLLPQAKVSGPGVSAPTPVLSAPGAVAPVHH